jgi:hypothetical protein
LRARSSSFAPGRGSADLDHAAPDFLAGGSEMGALMRAYDWASTPLGPVAGWSPTLRTTLRTMLANRFPHILWRGPRHIQLYNDAYIPIPGDKHPARAFGVPGEQGWSEIWHIIGPLVERPFQGGPPTWDDDILLEINRHGFLEETHFTVAYSPVPDDTVPSGIGGVLGTVHETTEKVIGERRVLALRDLAGGAAEAKTAEEACVAAAAILSAHPRDIPFALIYLLDGRAGQARLAGSAGVTHRSPAAPSLIDLLEGADGDLPWPIAGVVRSERIGVVEGLEARFGAAVPAGPWADPPRQAVVVPTRSNRAHELAGVLVAGVSPRLALDELYRSFLELVAGQIAYAPSPPTSPGTWRPRTGWSCACRRRARAAAPCSRRPALRRPRQRAAGAQLRLPSPHAAPRTPGRRPGVARDAGAAPPSRSSGPWPCGGAGDGSGMAAREGRRVRPCAFRGPVGRRPWARPRCRRCSDRTRAHRGRSRSTATPCDARWTVSAADRPCT